MLVQKHVGDLHVGDTIIDRLPGLYEPVQSLLSDGLYVHIGLPAGWQPLRMRADEDVRVEINLVPVSTMLEPVRLGRVAGG